MRAFDDDRALLQGTVREGGEGVSGVSISWSGRESGSAKSAGGGGWAAAVKKGTYTVRAPAGYCLSASGPCETSARVRAPATVNFTKRVSGELQVELAGTPKDDGTFDLQATLRNTGKRVLTSLAIVGTGGLELLAAQIPSRLRGAVYVVSGGDQPLPPALGPGGKATLVYHLRAIDAGRVLGQLRAAATDPAGKRQSSTGQADIAVSLRPPTLAEAKAIGVGAWVSALEGARRELARGRRELAKIMARSKAGGTTTPSERLLAQSLGQPDNAYASIPDRPEPTLEQKLQNAALKGKYDGWRERLGEQRDSVRKGFSDLSAMVERGGPEEVLRVGAQQFTKTTRGIGSAYKSYERFTDDLLSSDPDRRAGAAARALDFSDRATALTKQAVDSGIHEFKVINGTDADYQKALRRDPVKAVYDRFKHTGRYDIDAFENIALVLFGAGEGTVAREAAAVTKAGAVPETLQVFNAEREFSAAATAVPDLSLEVGGIPAGVRTTVEEGLGGIEAGVKANYGVDAELELQVRPTNAKAAQEISDGTSVAKGDWNHMKTVKPAMAEAAGADPIHVGRHVMIPPNPAQAKALIAAAGSGTPEAAQLQKAQRVVEDNWNFWHGVAPERASYPSQQAFEGAQTYFGQVQDVRRALAPGGAEYTSGIGTGVKTTRVALVEDVGADGAITVRVRDLQVGPDVLVRDGVEMRTGSKLPTIGTDIDGHALGIKFPAGKPPVALTSKIQLEVSNLLRKIPQWGRHGLTMDATDVTAAEAANLRMQYGLSHAPADLSAVEKTALAKRLKISVAELEKQLAREGYVVKITSKGTTVGPGVVP